MIHFIDLSHLSQQNDLFTQILGLLNYNPCDYALIYNVLD